MTAPDEPMVVVHTDEHHVGAQAGPGGMTALWCKEPGCTWREVRRSDAAGAR